MDGLLVRRVWGAIVVRLGGVVGRLVVRVLGLRARGLCRRLVLILELEGWELREG